MFRGFSFIPENTHLRFISKRMAFFVFSGLLVATAIGLIAFKGLTYGIDFQGGIMIDVRTQGPADIASMRKTLNGLDLGEVALQEFGQPNDVLIRIQRQEGGDAEQQAAVGKVKQALGDSVEYRRTEFVGPKVSDELFMDGLLAVSFAIVAMLAYIWFRFEWQFGLAAVIALVHDVVSTIGVFSLIEHEFNLSTVAAVLTIAGYSINDTVVVFDRVRENLRRYKKMPLPQLFDESINQTLSRTLMTSLTTLVALAALYFLGGEVIRDFSFAMIWGIVVGTYSSICLAVPLLLYLNLGRGGAREEAGKGAKAGAGKEEAAEPSP